MKKIDVGTVVQMLANIGVIAGIVILAVEIRGNTTATQAQTLQAAAQADQEFLFSIGADSGLSRLWTTYLGSPESLSPEERAQGAFLFSAQLRRLENVYLQYQIGALPDEAWQSRQGLFSSLANSPGYAAYAKSGFARNSSDEILEYMNELASRGQ